MSRRQIADTVLLLATAMLLFGFSSDAGSHNDPIRTALVSATVRTITNNGDAGADTLRQALLDAVDSDTIRFSPLRFPPSSPVTITLNTGLPTITQNNLTIDASDAGVVLDGSTVGGDMTAGLNIQTGGATVRGLQIVNFSGCGIEIQGQSNTIGGDRQTGNGPLGQGNLLSGNKRGGVCLFNGANHNTVTGNLIGVDVTGMNAWGSQGDGVGMSGGDHNLVEDNVISSQTGSGIQLSSLGDAYNTIRNNLIGVGVDGQTAVYSFDKGINLHDGAHDNVIGPGNIIANTLGSNGIAVVAGLSQANTIQGNSIFGNEGSGILLWNDNMDLVRVPAIATFDLAAGVVTGVTCAGCLVQIYSDEDNEGRVYEGHVTADADGAFSFNKGSALAGPHVTATATDSAGTTSMFSVPTAGSRSIAMQTGNSNPVSRLETLDAEHLPDNRLGFYVQDQSWVDNGMVDATVLNRMGVKHVRGQMNDPDSYQVNWETDELAIHDNFDQMITGLEADGIEMVYNLIFWDKEHYRQIGHIDVPRFQTEEEILRYLQFVTAMVDAFGDRVDTWEIWNEPSFEGSYQWIRVEDYIDLVKRVIPILHAEDPGSKIVVGSYHGWDDETYEDYLYEILESEIVPLVDVVAWHPFIVHLDAAECGGELFHRYPKILAQIKSIATAHGFGGEFRADELRFATRSPSTTDACAVSDRTAGKYYSREIVHHLGEGVGAGVIMNGDTQVQVMEHLGTLMAGAQALSLPVSIVGPSSVVSYTFALPNGDRLVAVWNNVDIVDEETATSITLMVPDSAQFTPYGIEVLTGIQQRLVASSERGDLVVKKLLVKDYPLLVRLASHSETCLPAVMRQ